MSGCQSCTAAGRVAVALIRYTSTPTPPSGARGVWLARGAPPRRGRHRTWPGRVRVDGEDERTRGVPSSASSCAHAGSRRSTTASGTETEKDEEGMGSRRWAPTCQRPEELPRVDPMAQGGLRNRHRHNGTGRVCSVLAFWAWKANPSGSRICVRGYGLVRLRWLIALLAK